MKKNKEEEEEEEKEKLKMEEGERRLRPLVRHTTTIGRSFFLVFGQ